MAGIFYSVATPIGNLEDITFRALKVLETVDLILCEDTRNTKVLLKRYNLNTPLKSYHKFNESERCCEILDFLDSGKNVALVTDAGTPCISDPGNILIEKLIENNIKIVPISGACAIVTFLSALHRKREEFIFVGFLPRKEMEQKKLFQKYNNLNIVFYESPKRLAESLQNLAQIYPEKKVAIGRELTKKFEEIIIESAQNLVERLNNDSPKGEIVGMIYAAEATPLLDETAIINKIKKLKKHNFSNKDISNILSSLFDLKKNNVYSLALGMQET